VRVIDLAFPIKPHFRWKVGTELRSSHAKGDLFQTTMLTIHCHAFTHVDAPVHFLPGGRHVAELPVDQWVGDAAVVDLTHVEDNGEVTAAHLEQQAQHVRAGDIAVLRTDWPKRVSVDTEHSGRMPPIPAGVPASG
jgi:arylformamidase